ncbi:MAG: flagellar type III secretion system pore protein FliP [Rhizobiales bacterium]|nr:flagellar type III secretion system pore protein FliP [Hyphomicrobiales bacterium]
MRIFLAIVCICILTDVSMAQEIDLSKLVPEGDGTFTGRIIQGLIVLTVLSIAPGILISTTCFTRFIIAFSFLRSGLGMQSTPSNLIIISLALFMTYFVMAPVFEKSWEEGVQPLLENKISQEEAFDKVTGPMKDFMLQHVRPKDMQLFVEASNAEPQNVITSEAPDLKIIVPAFMLSELRKGFEIGFLILLPFLILDLVVATVTMSMGMMMLPPTVVSLPFKVLFFVLIDGWNIIVGELLNSVI